MRISPLKGVAKRLDRSAFVQSQSTYRHSAGKEEFLKSLQSRRADYFSRCLLLSYHGSFAYGIHPLADLTHDLDLVGISVPSKEYYLGWQRYIPESFEGLYWNDLPIELVDHEIKHFILMLLKSSPNMLPLLWTDEAHLLYVTEAGRRLIDSRDLFVSKQFFENAKGFAHNCLLSDRQPRGYYHAIRMLRLAKEFLVSGTFQVNRTALDADELREIKTGRKQRQEVLELYEKALGDLILAHQRSKLPEVPDSDGAQKLMIDLIELQWKRA